MIDVNPSFRHAIESWKRVAGISAITPRFLFRISVFVREKPESPAGSALRKSVGTWQTLFCIHTFLAILCRWSSCTCLLFPFSFSYSCHSYFRCLCTRLIIILTAYQDYLLSSSCSSPSSQDIGKLQTNYLFDCDFCDVAFSLGLSLQPVKPATESRLLSSQGAAKVNLSKVIGLCLLSPSTPVRRRTGPVHKARARFLWARFARSNLQLLQGCIPHCTPPCPSLSPITSFHPR